MTGRAVQPRHLALLTLLAAGGHTGCSRDKLIGLLWPDCEEDKGRHHLSQALYVLRKALGQDAIVNYGDSVGLETEVVWTDVTAFCDARDRDDLEGAVQFYSGPFLDGFYLRGAAGFEKWADGERRRFATEYAQTLESLAILSEAAGDHQAAIVWWERLLAHDPFNSRVVVQLMQALAVRGDPANAIRYAREHGRLLADEFGMAVPEEVVSLANHLRESETAGQRAADLPVRGRLANTKGAARDPGWMPLRGSGRLAAGRIAVMASAIVLALVVGWRMFLPPANVPTPVRTSIAVLPFDNVAGDEEMDGWTRYAADRIAGAIAGLGFSVFDAQDIEPIRRELSEADRLDERSMATALTEFTRADHQLRGSLYTHTDSVTLEARLLAFPSLEVVAARSTTAPLARLSAAIQWLADSLQVATATWFDLPAEYLESYGRGGSYAAWREVDTARKLYRQSGGGREAFVHLRRALEIDSTYDAAAGLAMIWHLNLGQYSGADSLYHSMQRRIGNMSERQRWQLAVAGAVLRRDGDAVLDAFRDWRERLPARSSYNHEALGAIVANRPGECLEALSHVATDAEKGDPWVGYAMCHHTLGQYGSASETARECLLRDPEYLKCRYELARADAALGDPREAVILVDSLTSDFAAPPDNLSARQRFESLVDLGLELRAHGHPDVSSQVLAQAVEWYARSVEESPTPANRWRLARALYAAGRWEEARDQFAVLSPEELLTDPLLLSHNIDVSLLGYRAALAVRLDEEAAARRLETELTALDRPLLWGDARYWLATIAAVRGDKDRAVEELTEAMRLGLFAAQWGSEYPKWDFHIDPDFESVREYDPFMKLIASRR